MSDFFCRIASRVSADMGRRTAKQQAAHEREAVRRAGPNAVTPPVDPSLAKDPSFVAEPWTDSEDVPDGVSVVPASLKRKRTVNSDRDLIPESSTLSTSSRTTAWRNSTGQTQQARAKNMQPSINSLFQRIPNKRKATLAVREESEEPDSDIEILEAPVSVQNQEVEESEEGNSDIEMLDAPPLTVEPEIENPVGTVGLDAGDITMESPLHEAPPAVVPSATVPFLGASNPVPTAASNILTPVVPTSAQSHLSRLAGQEADIVATHTKLRGLVKKTRTMLKKKATILIDQSAAGSILDLEAIDQYNDKLRDLSLKKAKLTSTLATAARRLRPRLKITLSRSHPAKEASLAVAHRCGRGEYFARSIREMAEHGGEQCIEF
ncbi:hypothetical protein DFH09DRAFT_1455819 [Mycena vulgaris]|nr:hypothetical protein DFH09DRAFT_1455819 [Mycena vulgaris]